MRVQAWWSREVGTLWVYDFAHSFPTPVMARCSASFQEVDDTLREQLWGVMALSNPRRVLERLETGRRCFVAIVEGRIVAYAWVSQGHEHIGELERVLVFPRGDSYVWDCATVPDFRRQRLYSALLSHVLVALRAEGVQRVWIAASRFNHPSIRGIAVAGFRLAVGTSYLRLWRVRYLRLERHHTATPALVAEVQRLIGQRGERKFGSMLIGFGRLSPR